MTRFFNIYIAFILLLFSRATLYSQSTTYSWAKSAGGVSEDMAIKTSIDSGGNNITSGYYSSSSISFDANILTNFGDSDIFIVKNDSLGNVLWAKNAGGSSSDYVLSQAIDFNGNIYITGFYNSTTIAFDTIILTNIGAGTDMFLVKYNSLGNVVWAKNIGNGSIERGEGVCTDLNGNVYVTGMFSGICNFDAISLTDVGSGDAFIVKYDSLGNALWAKSIGDVDRERGIAICNDPSGNIVVSGIFDSPTLTIGSSVLVNQDQSVIWKGDVFFVKYDPNGNVVWAKSAGGASMDNVIGSSSDPNGNILMTGLFMSPEVLCGSDTVTVGGFAGSYWMILKLDASGNFQWVKYSDGLSPAAGAAVCSDLSGNVYSTGYFRGTESTFSPITLSHIEGDHIVILKYNPSGLLLAAECVGGTYHDDAKSIALDQRGNIYVSGGFTSSNVIFGNDTVVNAGSTSYHDVFLVKLSLNDFPVPIISQDGIDIYPNPSNGLFSVRSKELITKFEVVNSLGEKVCSREINSNSTLIDISTQAKGIYLVKICFAGGSNTKKVIVAK